MSTSQVKRRAMLMNEAHFVIDGDPMSSVEQIYRNAGLYRLSRYPP